MVERTRAKARDYADDTGNHENQANVTLSEYSVLCWSLLQMIDYDRIHRGLTGLQFEAELLKNLEH